MPASSRVRRLRLVFGLALGAVGTGAVLGIFCFGHAGLFRIIQLSSQERRLHRELDELKAEAAVLRSDNSDLQQPERIRRIARERLGMVPRRDSADSSRR
jgi:cell division protein FtsL